MENKYNFELFMDMLILCFLANFLFWYYDSLPSGDMVLKLTGSLYCSFTIFLQSSEKVTV